MILAKLLVPLLLSRQALTLYPDPPLLSLALIRDLRPLVELDLEGIRQPLVLAIAVQNALECLLSCGPASLWTWRLWQVVCDVGDRIVVIGGISRHVHVVDLG